MGKKRNTNNIKNKKNVKKNKNPKSNKTKKDVKEVRNFKGIKLTKKQSIIGVATLLVIVIAIVAITCIVNKSKNKKNLTAELRLSQNYDQVKANEENVDNTDGKVKFDAFFLKDINGDGKAESLRGSCNEIGSSTNLYMELNVLEGGSVKNSKIAINSSNFYFATALVKDNEISNNYISNNTKEIVLNDITHGTEKLVIGTVRSGDYSSSNSSKASAIGNDTTKYSKENSVTYSGIYVASDGTETPFSKTVPFKVDWYGEVNCGISNTSREITFNNISDLLKDEKLQLNFNITTNETKNQLIMKSSNISGTIPDLNGCRPESVKITGTNVTYTYDEETGSFTAKRESTVNENGIITTNAYSSSSYNSKYTDFNFTVIYPKEAYETMGEDVTNFEIKIPVEAVNTGYNNPNEEDGFINPFTSNTAKATVVVMFRKYVPYVPGVTVYSPSFKIYVGEYYGSPFNCYAISKQKPLNIYNGNSLEEKNDTYLVDWSAYTGTNGKTNGIVMNETTNKVDSFNGSISMEDVTVNKGIYFSGAEDMLGNDGWIKVYNADTGTLLNTFTSSNWNNYSSSNPYQYSDPVKHIKVETSKTNADKYFHVYNIKELDDEGITSKFTKQEFDDLKTIYSYLDGTMLNLTDSEDNTSDHWYKRSVSRSARYIAPTSIASIHLSKSIESSQSTIENEKITINTENTGYNTIGWKNGMFLVKLPSEIIQAEINNITISNKNVKISGYDLYEENGSYFVKILTENQNEESYNIVIDCNLTPDPRNKKVTRDVKLYAINGIGTDYYYNSADEYDLNSNQNTSEKVNYRTVSLTLDPGASLTTTISGSNYGKEGEETLAPRVAKTDKNQRTATIKVSATNNYNYDTQDIKILGVIPFEGNKYVITGSDLGSEYTTSMSDTGIRTLTNSIKDKVTVYYSTVEKPNENLDDATNGWTLAKDVRDFSKIKTYLIKLDNSYKMKTGEKIEFEYDINIPTGIDYNETSYAEHAIYFALDTDEGLYYTKTGSSKLGFMICKQYDLELLKYQKDKEKKLNGVTFKLTEDGKDSSTIRTTNNEGIAIIPGLYVQRWYTLKEINTTDDYVLNQEEIRFYTDSKINEDNTESLILKFADDKTYSWIRESSVYNPSENGNKEDYKVNLKLDNDVKVKLKINKKNMATSENLKNVKFTLNGEGKENTILSTDKDGNIAVSGLLLDKEYTLEEVKATNYYLPRSPIKFTIRNNNGTFELDYTDNGSTKTRQITLDNEIPTINLELQNEKIPTYSLNLTKYAKGETNKDGNDKKLESAQYVITGEGLPEKGRIYTTDENGALTIDNLYQFVEGKYITGEYTIKEIYAPEGYTVNSTALKFKAYKENGELKVQIIEGEGVIRNIVQDGAESRKDLKVENATSVSPIVKIGAEDSQIFSLFKYTNEGTSTETPVAGAKFKITDLDGNYVTGSDGKRVGEWFSMKKEEDVINPPSVLLSSNSTYKWTARDDGTWESTGNYNINSSTSTLTSENFELKKPGKITFDWSVSSESASYDYVYYTITEVKTNKTIGGESTKIGGTGYGTSYDSLKFDSVSLDLEAGTYKIEFVYKKDGSVNSGLDAAFVKNVKVSYGDSEEEEKIEGYFVTTDENGNLVANLKEGVYKAVEVYVPDRYVLAEDEKDRTYYFGIGASVAATWDWKASVTGKGFNYINSVLGTKDNGVIAVGNFTDYPTDVVTNATDGIDIDNDGIIDKISTGYSDGLIIKYDSAGKVKWSKQFGSDLDDSLKKVIQTTDGGYLAVGYVSSNDVMYDGTKVEDISKTNSEMLSKKDGVMIKLDQNGNYQWGIRIGGTLDDEISSVIETSQGNYAITGSYYSKTFNFLEKNDSSSKANITNSTSTRNAFVASYSSDGRYLWSSNLTDSSNVDAPDITEYKNGLAIAKNKGSSAYVDLYSLAGASTRQVSVGSGTSKITSLDTTKDKDIIAGVNITSKQFDAAIYKITSTGTSSKIYQLSGSYDEYVSSVKVTSDDGILFGGWYYSKDTTDNNGLTFAEKSGEYACDGYVIKLDKDAKVEYSSRLYGDSYDIVNSVSVTKNGGYLSAGSFNSNTLSATNFEKEETDEDEGNKELLITNVGNTDAFIISEGASGAGIAEAKNLQIENKIKKFKVTTEVLKNNGVFGGEIDGETGVTIDNVEYTKDTKRFVEKVQYGKDSTKNIKITPEQNYVIKSITINNEEYKNFKLADDGTVTIPAFTNVTKDIHVIVQFSNTISSLEVNHYLYSSEGNPTTTTVADSEYYTADVGSSYTTVPKIDIGYELITNKEYYKDSIPDGLDENDYYIPSNYKGTYDEGKKQVVNYYYKEKKYNLTVHHYLDGKAESVPLKGSVTGEKVADEITNNLSKNSDYTTNKASEDKIDYSIYELVSTPLNATGKITENTEVIYYYRVKTADITLTKVAEEDHLITIDGAVFNLYKYVGEGTSNNERIDRENIGSNWELAKTTTSSSDGTLKLEDLQIDKEYRLVEVKVTGDRVLPDGEWKIEFIHTQYDENDTSIISIDGVPIRVTAVGNPPALVKENGKLLLPNKKTFDFPTSGNKGIKNFYKYGTIIIFIGIVIFVIVKWRMSLNNEKKGKNTL